MYYKDLKRVKRSCHSRRQDVLLLGWEPFALTEYFVYYKIPRDYDDLGYPIFSPEEKERIRLITYETEHNIYKPEEDKSNKKNEVKSIVEQYIKNKTTLVPDNEETISCGKKHCSCEESKPEEKIYTSANYYISPNYGNSFGSAPNVPTVTSNVSNITSSSTTYGQFKTVSDPVKEEKMVRIVSDGTSEGTKVIETETGKEILVESISWYLDINSVAECNIQVPKATLNLKTKATISYSEDENNQLKLF